MKYKPGLRIDSCGTPLAIFHGELPGVNVRCDFLTETSHLLLKILVLILTNVCRLAKILFSCEGKSNRTDYTMRE